MKVVKIKMTQDFQPGQACCFRFRQGKEYYAIDAGDYWLTQREFGYGFTYVIPKQVKGEVGLIESAEVVPVDELQLMPRSPRPPYDPHDNES